MSYYTRRPKKSKEEKTLFTIYHNHTRPESERVWTQNYYQVCAIDPAIKNFALRVEQRYSDGRIIPVLFSNNNFTPRSGEDEKKGISNGNENTSFDLASKFLDQYYNIFKECHIFIIERQMAFNFRALSMSLLVLGYLHTKLRDAPLLPIILLIDAKVKTQQLGGALSYKGENNAIKKWAVDKAIQLLTLRCDKYSLDILNKQRKKDDLADTVVMIEALFSLWNLPLTRNMSKPKLITS